jgi:hypothetical protein
MQLARKMSSGMADFRQWRQLRSRLPQARTPAQKVPPRTEQHLVVQIALSCRQRPLLERSCMSAQTSPSSDDTVQASEPSSIAAERYAVQAVSLEAAFGRNPAASTSAGVILQSDATALGVPRMEL